MKSAEVQAAFRFFDNGGKGHLTKHEFKCAVVSLFGNMPFKVDVEYLLAQDQEGIDCSAFSKYVTAAQARNRGYDAASVFRAMDSSSKGYLTCDNLCALCAEVGGKVRSTAVMDAFCELDTDRDGRLVCADVASAIAVDAVPDVKQRVNGPRSHGQERSDYGFF